MENHQSIFDLLAMVKATNASDEEVFRKVTSFIENRARESGTPYHGHFELTPLCNLDCKMCYVHLNRTQMVDRNLLPANTWIDLMQQAIDAGMASVNLSGGECLTYPQFDDIFLFLKAKGISIGVLTNGILLDHNRIEFFKQHSPNMIQISLYGYSDDTYEHVTGKRVFSTVIANILELKAAKIPLTIAITPSKYMGDSVKGIIQLAKELNLPYFINNRLMTPREETGKKYIEHDIDLDEYLEIFKFDYALKNIVLKPQPAITQKIDKDEGVSFTGLKCAAGRSMFSIRWDGNMYPCSSMESIKGEPLREGFIAAWRYINKEVSSYPRFNKCDECVYSGVCSFCSAENEKRGSRYRLNSFWCEKAIKFAQNGMYQKTSKCD